jgi:hypothetical protein
MYAFVAENVAPKISEREREREREKERMTNV